MKHLFQFNSATISILISNLLLLFIAIFFKWDALSVFVMYIIETIIIGIFHIFKMIGITAINQSGKYKIKDAPGFSGLIFRIVFFTFHFGIFVFVQTTLVLPKDSGHLFLTITTLGNYVSGKEIWFLFFLIGLNLWATIRYLFIDDDFEGKDFAAIFMEPYPRIFVQQFVVILGSFFLVFKGASIIFLFIFILTKTFFEWVVTLKMDFKTE
jgi:hypothetical protein